MRLTTFMSVFYIGKDGRHAYAFVHGALNNALLHYALLRRLSKTEDSPSR